MSWLLAVALVVAGTLGTLLALIFIALLFLAFKGVIARGYRSLLRRRRFQAAPARASQ